MIRVKFEDAVDHMRNGGKCDAILIDGLPGARHIHLDNGKFVNGLGNMVDINNTLIKEWLIHGGYLCKSNKKKTKNNRQHGELALYGARVFLFSALCFLGILAKNEASIILAIGMILISINTIKLK